MPSRAGPGPSRRRSAPITPPVNTPTTLAARRARAQHDHDGPRVFRETLRPAHNDGVHAGGDPATSPAERPRPAPSRPLTDTTMGWAAATPRTKAASASAGRAIDIPGAFATRSSEAARSRWRALRKRAPARGSDRIDRAGGRGQGEHRNADADLAPYGLDLHARHFCRWCGRSAIRRTADFTACHPLANPVARDNAVRV